MKVYRLTVLNSRGSDYGAKGDLATSPELAKRAIGRLVIDGLTPLGVEAFPEGEPGKAVLVELESHPGEWALRSSNK